MYKPRGEIGVLLVEVLEGLGCLGLEGGLPGQALEHDGAETPEVGLGVVLQGHDHLGSLKYTEEVSGEKVKNNKRCFSQHGEMGKLEEQMGGRVLLGNAKVSLSERKKMRVLKSGK